MCLLPEPPALEAAQGTEVPWATGGVGSVEVLPCAPEVAALHGLAGDVDVWCADVLPGVEGVLELGVGLAGVGVWCTVLCACFLAACLGECAERAGWAPRTPGCAGLVAAPPVRATAACVAVAGVPAAAPAWSVLACLTCFRRVAVPGEPAFRVVRCVPAAVTALACDA